MRIYRKINHIFIEKSGHLIILSNDKPLHGEWTFNYRPDEKGIMHPVCYLKQDEFTYFDSTKERKIIASNQLPSDSVLKIPIHQEQLIKQRYDDGYPCELMIEYEKADDYTDLPNDEQIRIIDGTCNIQEATWNKAQMIWELNHILNVAICQGKLKNPNSNTVAEFVDNWLETKYKIRRD